MASKRNSLPIPDSRYTFRARNLNQRLARIRLRYELLESRTMLAAEVGAGVQASAAYQQLIATESPKGYTPTSAPITWFETFSTVERIPLPSLASVDQSLPLNVAGPVASSVGEWIVQLKDTASRSLRSLSTANVLLNGDNNDFTIISGLGKKGLLLVRGEGVSKADIEASLAHNSTVDSYSLNQLISGQDTTPNDTDFVRGAMPSLTKIGLPTAWNETRGSLSTVVGVLDTGIDLAHRDLYLNIWFNQGEIPASLLDDTGDKLKDIDGDGLITFYDLNNVTRAKTAPYSLTFGGLDKGLNAKLVKDLDHNGNGYIDGLDILADPLWADGRDTDGNGEVDDFFGVNFRGDGVHNNPLDGQGHGTHVAGTIGAIGGNGTGVTGINWQTSLMALRILDDNNQGDTGAAIKAVNYATNMRERYTVDNTGRVTQGANVRVLNNSWGQPGGFESSLETTIKDSGDAGILFVAASGNGNFLGQGVDNDRTSFYPASYDSPNVIAVAASGFNDSLTSFSNFGAQSVDIAAPGAGVRSTELGGGYGTRNGTSMATPHVAGVAALVWSALPDATVDEVRKAIFSTVNPIVALGGKVKTGGRLNAGAAINANVFAPAARLVDKQNITTTGGTSAEFTVEYFHRLGINAASIGNDDLTIARQWGPADLPAPTLKAGSIVPMGNAVRATYVVQAPGGNWDALDFGDYLITTNAGKIVSKDGRISQTRDVGKFNVRINEPAVLYVSTFSDIPGSGSLRDAIIAANAAGAPRTIILDSGTYNIGIPSVQDPASTFPQPPPDSRILHNLTGWSNASTGDFDIVGSVTIVGNQNDFTIIDGKAFDRVFKVHPGAKLELQRLTITGGISPSDQGGGGILSAGDLALRESIVRGNVAIGSSSSVPISGGGIASWDGHVDVLQSWIAGNQSNFGGGVFVSRSATVNITRSTLSNNQGGGLESRSAIDGFVSNSTFSGNISGHGAISGVEVTNSSSDAPSLSADGRFVAFESFASNLVPGDTNRLLDVFVYDRNSDMIERVSMATDGTQANGFTGSFSPSISADGRFVAFQSDASNLVPGDTNDTFDVFVYDRDSDTIKRVNVAADGMEASEASSFYYSSPSLSADGRFVAFLSAASNLVPGDTNFDYDVFVYDRNNDTIKRVSLAADGSQANSGSDSPSLSADGRFVAFSSNASNLVPGDTNGTSDVFVYDRNSDTIQRVSLAANGTQADNHSWAPSLSADGRFVTFESIASNLVLRDTNEQGDVFVYDRNSNTIQRVSVAADGTQADSTCSIPSLSADGRFVTFSSDASNLVPGDTNEQADVFVYDRNSNTIERVSVATDGTQGNAAFIDSSYSLSLSADGRFVAFSSFASNLIPGGNDPLLKNVFVYDRNSRNLSSISFLNSLLYASQLTVVGTLQASFAVSGRVVLNDTLLLNPNTLNASSTVNNLNVIQSPTPGAALIGGLTRTGFEPPVHPLLRGNPAINAGSATLVGTSDQLGHIRSTPDIGAVEAIDASVSGRVYIDLNENQILDISEPIVSDTPVSLHTTLSDRVAATDALGGYAWKAVNPGMAIASITVPPNFAASSPQIQKISSLQQNIASISLNADGRFAVFESRASNLVPGDTNDTEDVFVYDRNSDTIERVSVAADGTQADSNSRIPSMSADGRFVAFESFASNLVPGDTNDARDIFVYDRISETIERVSVAADGTQANNSSHSASLSADGRFVAFASGANNLVPGDINGNEQVFVYDRISHTIERFSVAADSTQADSFYGNLSLSADGRFVAFEYNRNLVTGDTDVVPILDVFVYDRNSRVIERVSVAADGTGAASNSSGRSSVTISADGRFVAFQSDASNLVLGDTNAAEDVFVYDRNSHTIERVSVASDGTQANSGSFSLSLSADGRFVAFQSIANDLVPGDTNSSEDTFVYDRNNDTVKRVSVASDGTQANSGSFSLSLSADARFVAFQSFASNLVKNDADFSLDIFFVANPLVDFRQVKLNLVPGDEIMDLNFGLVPNPGTISGRLFNDTAILNGVYDLGEEILPGRTVFIDANLNGVLDPSEPTAVTNASSIYQFTDLPSYRNYVLRATNAPGFERITPRSGNDTAFTIFLPEGGNLSELDFGFRPIVSTGQSSDSTIRGRVMRDLNSNGIVDAGDLPASDRTVFLDGGKLGVRDFDDPQAVTDRDGNYSFTGLASTLTPVRLVLDEDLVQVAPFGNELLGNDSQPLKFPLGDKEQRGGNPQSVVTGDFNGDGFAGVAVLLSQTNQISIRLNDQHGGFTNQKFDFTLSDFATQIAAGNDFAAPTAMVAAQLDENPNPDFAIVGNFTGNVLVLLNFDAAASSFSSKALLKIGDEPLDIVAGQFAGNASLDLVVLNKGLAGSLNDGDETVQILTNNGSGVFTVGTPIVTGGKEPVSLAVANFAGSNDLDIAVTHSAPLTTATTSGGVTILVGDGKGGLKRDGNYYEVQASPLDSAVGDFNKDGKPDLAVVNLKSNSVSILLGGQAGGKLRVQSTTLGTVDGAYDVAVADIDNDGDDDVIATKLDKRQVSIFRNIGVDPITKDVRFEPQENIGLGEFSFSERMPFAIANLDNDTSGPNGKGTLDIVAVPQNTDTLYVLPNHLVQGSHRVSVTGTSTDIALGIDFLVRSSILPPSFDFESLPQPIIEDAPEQTVTITGITKGRALGPALQFTVTSSNTDLIANPTITPVAGTDTATIHYKPLADANGTTVLTVRAVDAGADAVFGNADDGLLERAFDVRVLAVDDPVVTTIVLAGEGETFNLATTPGTLLTTIELIDVRGTGSNSLVLNIEKINQSSPNKKLSILADRDDAITFGAGWIIQTPSFFNGVFTHVITAPVGSATQRFAAAESETAMVRVELRNDRLLQNPLNASDADRDGKTTPLDALRVINEVRRRGAGAFAFPTKDSEISNLYFDVSGDNSLTALDALRVINSIARARRGGQAEGEVLASPPVTSVAMPSSTQLPSDPPESQLVIRSGITPAIDIDTPMVQSLVQTGTPAESLPKKSSLLSQDVRAKLSSDLIDDAFADPLLLNSIS